MSGGGHYGLLPMPKTGLSLPGFRTGTLMGNHDIRAGECDGMFSV